MICPPGDPCPTSLSTPVVLGAPDGALLDLPQLAEDQPAHRRFIAAHAMPWPGEMAVFRSAATDGFAVLISPGDLTIRWVRRSRSLAADSRNAGDVPLAEDSEAYEVEILDGATRRRTLQVAKPFALYTAAQQIADWRALLGPGNSLDIRVFQLSALIGRGAERSVTLTF